nr:SLC13 family permease [Candidatus Palauibacterales bacterium]
MPPGAILTIVVVAAAIFLITREVAPPDALLFAALVVLMAAGVVTPERALASFGNPAIATIGALFIVAAGMRSTGVLESASRTILGQGGGLSSGLARLTASTA